jgi:hypothetical protein
MEEEGPDALEVAAQAHEEGEAQAPEEVSSQHKGFCQQDDGRSGSAQTFIRTI